GSPDLNFDPGANGSVVSFALQADGRIVAGGAFTTLGGQVRRRLARLYPDGTLDPTFTPASSGIVNALALQGDERLLVGGPFTNLAGGTAIRIGRLAAPDLAAQVLSYSGSTISWQRTGTSPEAWRTTFDHSTNGLAWTPLGAGIRVSGGWQ